MSFLDKYERMHDKAKGLVYNRDSEGRNEEVPVEQQFNGTNAVLDLVYMKLQRARSYLAAGNWEKFVEECLDMANYSIFAAVFEDRSYLVDKAQEVLGADFKAEGSQPMSASSTQQITPQSGPDQTPVMIDGIWYWLKRSAAAQYPQDEAYAKLVPVQR